MLPLSTLNSVKERGSNGALRSHLFAKGRTRRGGSRPGLSEGGTLNYQLAFDLSFRFLLGCELRIASSVDEKNVAEFEP
jgi:hypothetical protein